MRFLFVTMDGNHDAALCEAARMLQRAHHIDLQLSLYNATTLRSDDDWQRLAQDALRADLVFGSMLFGEELVRPLQRILADSAKPVCIITSNPALVHCTRLGKFILKQPEKEESPGLLKQWMSKFRPKKGHGESKRQLAMLRNVGKVLQHIPGKARDLHTYIVVHDYWLHSSAENIYRMLCLLINRYLPNYKDRLPNQEPIHYPDAAIYHPDAPQPFPDLGSYQKWRKQRGLPLNGDRQGSVGLLALRTVVLSGNTEPLDALIHALDEKGIEARAAYCSGLDFRPALDQFFSAPTAETLKKGTHHSLLTHDTAVDLLINGAGFSLVGGMAESRPDDARAALDALDVGYLGMIPLSFQRVEDWQNNDVGLTPMQMVMNIAVPELDGAAEPFVYGGPTAGSD